jgi:hypothetical protein
MRTRFFAIAVVAAGLAGCATDYVPPKPVANAPGPAYEREIQEGRPGLFGDLTWDIDLSGKPKAAEQATPQAAAPMTAAEQEEFKKWRESAGASERQEFEEWRAWQEWKRKNPK